MSTPALVERLSPLPGAEERSAASLEGAEGTAARNARVLLVMSVAQRALSLVVLALLARLLSVADLGVVGTAAALASLFGTLCDLGIEVASIRAFSELEERGLDGRATLGAALLLRGVLGVAGFLVGGCVLILGPFSVEVRLAGLIGLAPVMNPLWPVYGAVLQSRLQVSRLRAVGIASAVVSGCAAVAVAVAGGGAIGVLGSQAVVAAASSLLILRLGRRMQRARLRGAAAAMRGLVGFAWRLGIAGLLGNLYYRLDTVLLGAVAPGLAVAMYYSAYRLTEALAIFPGVIVTAAMPVLTRLLVADPERAHALSRRLMRVILAIGLFFAVAGSLSAPLVVHLLYGRQYLDAVPLIQTLLAATVLMFVNSACYQSQVAFGRARPLLHGAVLAAVVNVAANALLIPRLGAEGAALATVLTEAVMVLPLLPWLRRQHGLRPGRLLWGVAVGGLSLGVLSMLAGHAPLLLGAAAAAPAGVLVVVISGALDPAALRQFSKGPRRWLTQLSR